MITLDDKYRFEDWGLIIEEGHEHPAMPNFERKTIAIPGRAGLWDFGTETREKPFNLPIASLYANKKDQSRLQQKLNDFVAFLFDEFGQPREIKLVYDYEPDKFYTVKISDSFTPERIRPFAKFVLPFVAYDPYKYSKEEHEEESKWNTDDILWGSTKVTFEDDYLFGHKQLTGDTEIYVDDVDGLAIKPIFEIEGSAKNLAFYHMDYSLKLPDFEDTEWVVDFERYIVYKNGEESMIEIDEFFLIPGNRRIKIRGDDVDIHLSIKYRNKYM